MQIGVVSDTHNNLANVRQIVALFNEAKVACVVHTGDITQAKTLEVLAGLDMPLYGVFGNNDQEREALDKAIAEHGFTFQEPPLEVVWYERRVVIVHDPLELNGVLHDGHHLALHGHTHLYRHDKTEEQLIFNPGECAGHMKGLNAVGVVDLESLTGTLLRF